MEFEEEEEDEESIPELVSRSHSWSDLGETVMEDQANLTMEYYKDDEESCDCVPGEIVVEINQQVEIGINDENHWEDEENTMEEPPELISREDEGNSMDEPPEITSRVHEAWDCDDSTAYTMPELSRCHDDNEDLDSDSDESTIQSVDERVQSDDIPRDVTDMMIPEKN